MSFITNLLAIELIPLGDARPIVEGIIMIMMALLAIAMVTLILMQDGNPENLQAITGGSSDTFYGKNKGRSRKQILKRITIGIVVALVLVSIFYFLIQINIG